MPPFDQYPTGAASLIKMLYLGDGASGKTGSLCSLAAAGYTVRVLDLDGMANVIRDFMVNPKSIYLQARAGLWTAEQARECPRRITYVPVQETFHTVQGRTLPKAEAWKRAMDQLNDWKDGEYSAGSPSAWTERDVLVVDSLTRLCAAGWNWQLALNNRLAGRPEQNDYWQAQQLVNGVLNGLRTLPCHVIIVCHIDYIENDGGLTRGYPQTVGKALSPTLPRDFLHILMAKSSGQGTLVKRKILTTTTGTVDLRTPSPLRVKPEYELETGLAEYFRDIRGDLPVVSHQPQVTNKAATS